jgi:hypothetical protein
MEFPQAAAPNDGLPGVNPADLAPGGQPAFGAPPNFPQPNDPSMPGIDPGQVQPPPGMPQPPGLPRPPGVPVGPPGFAPRPGGPKGPGRPAMPQPPTPQLPAMPQPPGTAATVTLSNLRRGSGAGTLLEVNYEYTAGTRHPVFDKLIVRTADGIGEVDLTGPMRKTGTIRVRAIGAVGNLQGKVEVWMERRSAATLPGARGQAISNTVTLD